MTSDLADFLVPITDGTKPAPEGAGRLSPERAAALDDALRVLAEERGRAWAALRVDGRLWA